MALTEIPIRENQLRNGQWIISNTLISGFRFKIIHKHPPWIRQKILRLYPETQIQITRLGFAVHLIRTLLGISKQIKHNSHAKHLLYIHHFQTLIANVAIIDMIITLNSQ